MATARRTVVLRDKRVSSKTGELDWSLMFADDLNSCFLFKSAHFAQRMFGYFRASCASRSPENCQRVAGLKKLR